MARRIRSYTAEEVARIGMDVPDDSDVSDFGGEDGDAASDTFEPSSDSGDSDNSVRAVEDEDNSLDQSSDSDGEAGPNETTTSTRGRSSGRRRGRARSRSPVNRGIAEVSTVKGESLDEDVVSFPDFRGHGPVTLQVTESEPYDFFSPLFSEELWDVLVEQTNIHIAQKLRKSWFNNIG